MEMMGHIHNGVVVLDDSAGLPEGMKVLIRVPLAVLDEPQILCPAGELPLVRCVLPGSVNLTNQRIQEILDEEDAQRIKAHLNVPS